MHTCLQLVLVCDTQFLFCFVVCYITPNVFFHFTSLPYQKDLYNRIRFSHFQHIMKDSSDKPVATDTRLKSRPSVRPTLIFKFRQEQNVSGFYILGRWIVKNKQWLDPKHWPHFRSKYIILLSFFFLVDDPHSSCSMCFFYPQCKCW